MFRAENLTKTFVADGVETPVLQGVSLEVSQGEFVAVTGRSGSGKSTLLNVLATLLRPDSGTVRLEGRELTALADRELNEVRRRDLAVIFQFHYLLPYFTALENTLLPFLSGLKPVRRERAKLAVACLERVGLGGKERRLPGGLSGGEQQRVAIARALVTRSRLLFADEPTGSLDKTTGDEIMALLQELNLQGLTIVMVTHERDYATMAGRVLEMADGRLIGETRPPGR